MSRRNVVLVCGGRDFRNQSAVFGALDAIHAEKPITAVVQGGAAGADFLAKLWAKVAAIPCAEYPANWDKYGKSAGPRRNEWMLHDSHPDVVMAFPGGRGTAHMVNLAAKHGYSVRTVAAPTSSESPSVVPEERSTEGTEVRE